MTFDEFHAKTVFLFLQQVMPMRWKRTWDTLAERLRRRPAKPMGSARVGSNPTGVVFEKYICGVLAEWGYLDFQ